MIYVCIFIFLSCSVFCHVVVVSWLVQFVALKVHLAGDVTSKNPCKLYMSSV